MERTNNFGEKTLITYSLLGVGINIVAVIYIAGIEYIRFNCHTKYEDKANNIVSKIISESFGNRIIKSIKKNNCRIENE